MEDTDRLLKRMNSLIQRATALSTDLADFICTESIPIGEVIDDWLNHRGSGKANITLRETERLIEQRQTATRVKAKRRFAPQELGLLSDWQTLKVRALTLSINIVLRNSTSRERQGALAPG
ncbi:hypothetical protein [Microbulbifer litoralis]|uniref:hypothetical protein n=1 Tax=Microbulbifer litoralis TaxID=2933965 RepID=UPI00202912D9|nr:hypothetical protein [Microbulbifer sp. GX H0434]